jgi:hypothetical protein
MANPEHLEILKRGVEAWNKWRLENPTIEPDLIDAHLSHVYLPRANLSYADLSHADLSYAVLIGANLRGVNLRHANLKVANLRHADLFGASISDSDLIDANLTSANLSYTDFIGAILEGVYLLDSNFTSARLQNADFTNALIQGAIFTDIDLSLARGLDSVRHDGPSEISISTLYKSGGNIPEAFLRGCGVPDTFITFARSLVNAAIDFYSCFISYSSKNHEVAERLYADLQSKGVRCWFAPEDLKIGDKFRQQIDESIKRHDKLLLILSEQSISSAWVEEEVESAFEREHREKRLVLFPVRIDDAVINCEEAWAASLRRTRHIGDFTFWKEHDAYQKAFNRLLRDLKTEESK